MATKARDAFRTISEVADWLDVPAHVLRFWESKFSQIKPVKRAGGRRYYRPDDMMLIGGIKKLLHDDGMTIRGVQKMLKEDGVKAVSALSLSLDSVDEAATPRTIQRKAAAPDIEDAVEETSPEDNSLPAEDEVAVAAWEADAKSEAAAPQDREPLEIETSSAHEPAEEEVAAKAADEEPGEAPEAPFVDVEEETPQLGGDNIVELPSRGEDPEPDLAEAPEPEIATAPEPETQPEPHTDDADAQIDAQEQPDSETATPAEASEPPPEPPQEAFQLSEAQLATQALKRKLRGSRASTGDVEALAPHVARLQALRDRLAHDLSGQ